MAEGHTPINRDPIEKTAEYKGAMFYIQPILDAEFGLVDIDNFLYWKRKRALLHRYGIEWKSPMELNPHIAEREVRLHSKTTTQKNGGL